MSDERKCGCKGIRTCLLCEKGSTSATKSNLPEEAKCTYTYCPHCNLCWPDDGEQLCDPLFLDGVKIFPDFICEDEETDFESNIDKIPWMPSQSGRRKQDFGPKVNFKKKKVRIGEFRGFPKFTSPLLQRFQSLPGLSNFQPVELCHLEYTPERGSSIDPHVDDFWLWGERLVTINLGSPTLLTLVPCTNDSCGCREKCEGVFNLLTTARLCHHRFNQMSTVESPHCNDRNDSDNDDFLSSRHNDEILRTGHIMTDQRDNKAAGSDPLESTLPSNSSKARLLSEENGKIARTMCTLFRSRCSVSEVSVRVALPPRSLIVLASCARYNWTHEIKRQDVVSRRLAMTFRELTPEFLDGGKESVLGKELLTIASNFCDL